MKILGFVVSTIAGLVAIGAGSYLLVQQSASGDSWLEVIAHGPGAAEHERRAVFSSSGGGST